MDAFDPVDLTIQITEQRPKKTKENYAHLSLNDCDYILTGFGYYQILLDKNMLR